MTASSKHTGKYSSWGVSVVIRRRRRCTFSSANQAAAQRSWGAWSTITSTIAAAFVSREHRRRELRIEAQWRTGGSRMRLTVRRRGPPSMPLSAFGLPRARSPAQAWSITARRGTVNSTDVVGAPNSFDQDGAPAGSEVGFGRADHRDDLKRVQCTMTVLIYVVPPWVGVCVVLWFVPKLFCVCFARHLLSPKAPSNTAASALPPPCAASSTEPPHRRRDAARPSSLVKAGVKELLVISQDTAPTASISTMPEPP